MRQSVAGVNSSAGDVTNPVAQIHFLKLSTGMSS